jgi:hypothetical protein
MQWLTEQSSTPGRLLLNRTKAEMRITPEGVTTPDNAAGLHLSGRFYSEEDYDPEAAVVGGVNSYGLSKTSRVRNSSVMPDLIRHPEQLTYWNPAKARLTAEIRRYGNCQAVIS